MACDWVHDMVTRDAIAGTQCENSRVRCFHGFLPGFHGTFVHRSRDSKSGHGNFIEIFRKSLSPESPCQASWSAIVHDLFRSTVSSRRRDIRIGRFVVCQLAPATSGHQEPDFAFSKGSMIGLKQSL
jgi:hypothetical protein